MFQDKNLKSNKLLTPTPLSELKRLISEKGRSSVLYDMLVSNASESSTDGLKSWKEDLQEDISLDDWGVICAEAHRQTADKIPTIQLADAHLHHQLDYISFIIIFQILVLNVKRHTFSLHMELQRDCNFLVQGFTNNTQNARCKAMS